MSTNNKKAFMDVDAIAASIKEESKNTIKAMLAEAVKNAIRENCEEEDEEKDYEVVDDAKNDAENTEENPEATDVADSAEDGEESTEGEESDGEEASADEPSAEEEAPEVADSEEGEEPEADAEAEGDDDNAWDEFSEYQVGDNDTYDLTGEKDYDKVVKVYKLMNDDDKVAIVKNGDKVKIKDNEADTAYIIDLGADEEDNAAVDNGEAEIPSEGELSESTEDIAGFPSEISESKSRKPMKENKETLFEVDLGYTDSYQDKDPIAGLSNNEPSNGKSWEKGVPTGTSKPWAGESKPKGEPFKETVSEEEAPVAEEPVEEGTNVGGAVQQRTSDKSHIPADRKEYGPNKRHVSTAGNYNEVVAENKQLKKDFAELKESFFALRDKLQEAYVTNVNLGKITKLFLENTTSQSEKIDIVNRFSNEAKTVKQAEALYESINKDLKKVKPVNMNESTVKTAQPINEAKTYKSDDLLKTIDLMNRVLGC